MGKIKVKRKSTLIDMTAMSDVTVLLLTFFMLTSTFLQKEPVQVITPPSVATDKVPTSNVAQVLVATDDNDNVKVFLSIFGEADPDFPEADEALGLTPGMYASEPLRKEVMRQAVQEYQNITGENLGITEDDLDKFSKIGSFGVPLRNLKAFLNDPKQDEFMKEHMNDHSTGIPLNKVTKNADVNELQIWLKAVRNAGNPRLTENIRKDGTGIAVKADRDTKFSKINEVLESMRAIKMNKFTVMTALAAESED